ncbi:MAG: hypothetical protein ACI92G_001865 [Candidatus Pelagisphaera sp.]|jgi:hypothetical protein
MIVLNMGHSHRSIRFVSANLSHPNPIVGSPLLKKRSVMVDSLPTAFNGARNLHPLRKTGFKEDIDTILVYL